MKVQLLTVATDPWKDNTLGLTRSLHEHEDKCQLTIVDNACDHAYKEGYHIVRLDKRVSFAAALNAAAKTVKSGWMVMISNDVIINAPFVDIVQTLDPRIIWGKDANKGYGGRVWLDGWIYVMTKSIFDKVGGFDENFQYAGFEDADFCWRAQAAGITFDLAPQLPLTHLRKHTRYGEKDFFKKREANIRYLEIKYGL